VALLGPLGGWVELTSLWPIAQQSFAVPGAGTVDPVKTPAFSLLLGPRLTLL
jgi:hypothetical protein